MVAQGGGDAGVACQRRMLMARLRRVAMTRGRHPLAGARQDVPTASLGAVVTDRHVPGAAVSQSLDHLPGDLGIDFCVGVRVTVRG